MTAAYNFYTLQFPSSTLAYFMKISRLTRNEIIDNSPLNTNNTIIKLLRGEYKIDYANIGNFLAHILEALSELLRQTEVEQPG